jgi:hypothetical protein
MLGFALAYVMALRKSHRLLSGQGIRRKSDLMPRSGTLKPSTAILGDDVHWDVPRLERGCAMVIFRKFRASMTMLSSE